MDRIGDFYQNKNILVTGGVGSIGSVLVKKLLDYNPNVVRVLDINETGLFDLKEELQSDKIRTFVGDVRDKERLRRAFEGVDIVFHAAALKHVPLCEYNPFEAVKTNVIGTQNVMDIALDEEVEKVIMISTDKAVNPTNVMGATKLLAERLTISANYYRGDRITALSCVRFGNVLASRGSVIPLFKKQLEEKRPITITDPYMTRFVMTIPDAVQLILEAAQIAIGGEIFILKMPALNIKDLAEVMAKKYKQKYDSKYANISIIVTGKRPGEKLFEELISNDEKNVYENDKMFIILPDDPEIIKEYKYILDTCGISNCKTYSSKTTELLSKDNISELIDKLSN